MEIELGNGTTVHKDDGNHPERQRAKYKSWTKMISTLAIILIEIVVISWMMPWDYRGHNSQIARSPLDTAPINEHSPFVKRIGSPMPGMNNAYFGGWHRLSERTIGIVVTDTPILDNKTDFKRYKDRVVTHNGVEVNAKDIPQWLNRTSDGAGPQLRRRKHQKGPAWDHCTVWPNIESMSGCTKERSMKGIFSAAGEDHYRALVLYLLEYVFGEQSVTFPLEMDWNGGCVDYNKQRVCMLFSSKDKPPTKGWPLTQLEKRLVLDYSETCAKHSRGAQHALLQPNNQWRSVCVVGDWLDGECNHHGMGCGFEDYYEDWLVDYRDRYAKKMGLEAAQVDREQIVNKLNW